MTNIRREWVERGALGVVMLLPLTVGLRFLIDPVQYGASLGISLADAGAVETLRISMGAYHIGLALMAALGLFARELRGGTLLLLFAFMGWVMAVRLYGVAVDGYHPREIHGLLGESATTIALAVGAFARFYKRDKGPA